MRGVDTFNQSASYYNFHHRHIRWYRTIIGWLIEVTLNNAFLIYQKIKPEYNMSSLEFRMYIIKNWEENFECNVKEEEIER